MKGLKIKCYILLLLIATQLVKGQSVSNSDEKGSIVANINTQNNINSSALFEVRSSDKGMLPPRMTTVQINGIQNPANGLMAYDTDLKCLKVYNGTIWECAGADVVASTPLSSSYAFQSISDNYVKSEAIAADNAGNTVSVGSFRGAVTFGKNFNSMTLTAAGEYDGYIVKHNSDGELIWATQIAGSANDQEILDVDIDASGNIAVTGYLKNTTTFYSTNGSSSSYTTNSSYYSQIFVAKYNSSGILQWFKAAGSSGSYHCQGLGVAFDGSGNIFFTGFYKGGVAFDGQNFTSISNTDDIFIAKLNSAGVYSWIKTSGGTSNDEGGYRLVCDNSNNVYLYGWYQGTSTFGENAAAVSLTSRGDDDYFIAKYYSGGGLAWVKTAGGVYDDNMGGLAYSSVANAIYISGDYRGTLSFGPGLGTNPLAPVSSTSYYNGFLAKYDLNGNIQWSVRNGSTSSEHNYAKDVSTDNSGNPYITGTLQYNSEFYSFNSGTSHYVRGFQYGDPYLAKYNTSGALQWVILAPDGYDDSSVGVVVKNNTAFVFGNFKETINFGYQQLTSTNNSYNGNLFIWRYSE